MIVVKLLYRAGAALRPPVGSIDGDRLDLDQIVGHSQAPDHEQAQRRILAVAEPLLVEHEIPARPHIALLVGHGDEHAESDDVRQGQSLAGERRGHIFEGLSSLGEQIRGRSGLAAVGGESGQEQQAGRGTHMTPVALGWTERRDIESRGQGDHVRRRGIRAHGYSFKKYERGVSIVGSTLNDQKFVTNAPIRSDFVVRCPGWISDLHRA